MNNADYLLKIINENIDKICEIVDEKFSNDQLETIIKNVIGGKIHFYLSDKIHDIFIKRVNEMIAEELKIITEANDLPIIINIKIKEYMYSEEFKNYIGHICQNSICNKIYEDQDNYI